MRDRCFWRVLTCVFALACFSDLASGQGDRENDGLSREQMWQAPSAEDWARPVLITFQRTWEDAVELSRETGKAILVCINMDGEIASEHYAGIRYRQADVAELYDPYICVMASVYRHTPRDYDTNGERILCPRLGSVTCGEHIAIEPLLFEKFMEGKRISPRHIMVELDGAETYDLYYAFDTASVFDQVRDGIEQRDAGPVTEYRGDRPVLERVASRDVRDRTAVEKAYRDGDEELRRRLLEEALQHADVASADLMRMAIFGLDPGLAKLAREALAKSGSANAVELIAATLGTSVEEDERAALIDALERHGGKSPKARTLASVHRGLSRRSTSVDIEGWARAMQSEYRPAPYADPSARRTTLGVQTDVLAKSDPNSVLELAETFLAEARAPGTEPDHARLLRLDARAAAKRAEELGAQSWRVHAVLALSAWFLDDRDVAYARAEIAANLLPPGAADWNAMAVLDLFAKMRWRAIVRAVEAKEEWPRQWLTDIHAACAVLAKHPHGTDSQVVWHFDRLKWLGAWRQASRALTEGMERFPDSAEIHDRLRTMALERDGVDGLESLYERRLARDDAPANLSWYAGYASMVAAEFHRRAAEHAPAHASYDRAAEHFERHLARNAEARVSVDHYLALCCAGRARVAFESEDDARVLAELLRSFELAPRSAATLDGLELSAVLTARQALDRWKENDDEARAATMQAALDALDPDMLLPPAYDIPIPR